MRRAYGALHSDYWHGLCPYWDRGSEGSVATPPGTGWTMTIERDERGFDAPVPLGHPGRLGLPEGHPTGPEVGERLPDFTLPDAQGRLIDFHRDRGHSKAAVVFFRSAVW